MSETEKTIIQLLTRIDTKLEYLAERMGYIYIPETLTYEVKTIYHNLHARSGTIITFKWKDQKEWQAFFPNHFEVPNKQYALKAIDPALRKEIIEYIQQNEQN